MQSYHVLLLLGVLCVAIRAGQGTLELWLETGEAGRSSFKGKFLHIRAFLTSHAALR